MAHLRIALAQLNVIVGDIKGNGEKILDWTRRAAAKEAQLVLFPETALTGYPVEDLALRQSFIEESRQSVSRLASRLADEGLGELVVVVGYLDRTDEPEHPKKGHPQNVAAVLHRGEVVARYAKHHLPNYGVFDEFRYFKPGNELTVLTIGGVDVAVAICEDLWQDGGPVAATAEAGAGLLAVINASPYERDKDDTRGELVSRRAREAGCALAYVNLIGGQDELVFDGDSMISDADGTLIVRGPQFVEDLVLADLELPDSQAVNGPTVSRAEKLIISRHHVTDAYPAPSTPIEAPRYPRLSADEEVYSALVLGLRDYCGKNGIERVYLGLSGGIDSTLVATIASDAIGAANVYGISNPSAYSSEHSKTDAADLAQRLGLNFSTVPIAPAVDAFHSLIDIDGVAAENLQARIRAVIWMAESNQHNPSIVLACGNKSELAVGYSTIYGDAVGGFAPIKDVPKTWVWRLATWRNDHAVARGEQPPIPENSITKEPSAELRPGQKDTDSLPPYEVLDKIIAEYVEGDQGRAEIIAAGYDVDLVDRVMRMVDRAEYKRRQYPPGTKISFKAFGRDRRLPITNGWREEHPALEAIP
ncbi:NAD+ synthase [Microlunatus parietis]|uniref:Glutamine-dependent NAD(+) synthetase n=1 Tax=Microlunatus parietis TaxID=682979 RepID=A0A7Y9LBL1_9ACTN|nr:NAD+ synthase [Microlunatus parietis]NYE70963.1 NAD+ synthase (glutamine-hydrolyzing) [Microlunatus parietis]